MAEEAREDVRIEDHGAFLEAHLSGEFSLPRFIKQAAVAAAACHDRGRSRLLLNWMGVTGKMSTLERYDMGVKGAAMGEGLKVASYMRPDLIDPRKFGTLVARNRGLEVEVFSDREKALAWLLEPGEQDPEPT